MRRHFASLFLVCLTGCGSCVEEKRTPEVEPAPTASVPRVIWQKTDGGRRRIFVGEGPNLADILSRDGGPARRASDAGSAP